MNEPFSLQIPLSKFNLWGKIKDKRAILSFDLEITARCKNNCRHCYINLPYDDQEAKGKELSINEIKEIAEESIHLGAMWCLITGGEPLLREDFIDIYLLLKRKGLLISIFTNATLITKEHIKLLKRYPPRDIEISVYGVTEKTYQSVTRGDGSFDEFIKGMDLLTESRTPIRLKTMALRSNIHELGKISDFCRRRTKDYFRFDPFLHLRYDGNKMRNEEIRSERLCPDDIVEIERLDRDRFPALEKSCCNLAMPNAFHNPCSHLFQCGIGYGGFTVGHDGKFRLCSSLCHPECVFDLKKQNLSEIWNKHVPQVMGMKSEKKDFLDNCRTCPFINLCMWCPAHSYLEQGELDLPVEYFCKVAHARVKAFSKGYLRK